MTEGGVEFGSKEDALLSPSQREILKLLTEDFLTVKQIAQRRQTSNKAVYKIIAKLRKKGIPLAPRRGGLKSRGALPSGRGVEKAVRLHGQQLLVKGLAASSGYSKLAGRVQDLGAFSVRFNLHSVEFYYSRDAEGFYGSDESEAERLSFAFWIEALRRVGLDCGLDLLHSQVFVVKAHYAIIHSGIAFSQLRRGQALRLQAQDGREWFVVDNSLGLLEHEYVHPERARRDLQDVEPFLQDLRLHPETPVLSQLYALLAEQVKQSTVTGQGLLALTEILNKMRGLG